MATQPNAAPVIIKRKKIMGGHQHHGGAWKVAYADFVTAMMAFFMLMWLLNATTEKQRKGLADYFSPTASIVRVSGGGDGVFNGDSVFTDMTLVQNGTGASAPDPGQTRRPRGADGDTGSGSNIAPEDQSAFDKVEEALRAFSGESMVSEDLLRHVVTRQTDEGLVIEIFSLPGAPLFEANSDRPTPLLTDLARMIADVAGITVNPVAIGAHMPVNPVVLAQNPVWTQSGGRADLMRRLLQGAGFDAVRVRRLVGHGDRQPVTPDPMALRNERVEVILLRRGP